MPSTWGRSEQDTCRDYVLPALARSGWAREQIRAEYPVRAQRVVSAGGVVSDLGEGRVDYVLEIQPGLPVAVIEAKREYKHPADGLTQALRYAQQLDSPIAYSTNGHGIVVRDLRTGGERVVDSFSTPAELWSVYLGYHRLDDNGGNRLRQAFNRQVVDVHGDVIAPRWYQTVAVHRVLMALARGDRRVLLLMATGAGKTLTAMQIVAKLRAYERLVRPDRTFRVLYLADLDVLLTQPMNNDFRPAFGDDPLWRIRGGANTSRAIYFASYQALAGGGGDGQALFRDYPSGFFDLVIVDEAHRGSANASSSWRAVIEHFSPSIQIGLTATPKRDSTVDTYAYFGAPVFEYSLRQGIEEGYLAPYRVRRVVLSPDAEGWRPSPGQVDRFGRDIPDKLYETKDFERVVSLVERTRVAARHLSAILRRDPLARTMVFCVDMAHAEDMREAMVEANPDRVAEDPNWVVRIVGDEPERVRLLEAFSDASSDSPVVATTSKMLSTGVDVKDLKYVVLFRPIGSMVEFKQIIGRGARLYPEKGKDHFEIVDYVDATRKFDDPSFDGYPAGPTLIDVIDPRGEVVAVEVEGERSGRDGDIAVTASGTDGQSVAEPMPPFEPGGQDTPTSDAAFTQHKLFVDDDGFDVVAEFIQVPDRSSGRLRLTKYAEHVGGVVRTLASSAGELAERWGSAPTRDQVLAVLREHGINVADLTPPGSSLGEIDPLDLLVAAAWNVDPITRAERVGRVREQHDADLAVLPDVARQVLLTLLDRYAANGIDEVVSTEALAGDPLVRLGSPVELARAFGGIAAWHRQQDLLQQWLYSA